MDSVAQDGKLLLTNFLKFSISFSLTHAAVNCVLAFSSTLLGPELGSYGSSVLYLAYSVSTLLFSQSAIHSFGPKWTVLLGLGALQIYVLAFFAAILFPSVKWSVFMCGAFVGGSGAGILWVGQASYYTLNASSYSAAAVGTDEYLSTSNFAGYFAFFYLSFEVILQLFALSASLVDISVQLWQITAFGACAVCAVLGTIIMGTVKDLRQTPLAESSFTDSVRGDNSFELVYIALQQMFSNRRLLLCVPFQISFGLSSALINYYVNKFIVAETYGDGYVGLVMAVDTLSSALAVYPITYISNLFRNKSSSIVVGCLIYFFNACLLISMSDAEVARWRFLIPLFITHGISRCIWEGVNKALIAEYFFNTKETAFTAIYFWSGLSAGVSFFGSQYITKFYFTLFNLCWAMFSLYCFYLFHQLPVEGVPRSIPSVSLADALHIATGSADEGDKEYDTQQQEKHREELDGSSESCREPFLARPCSRS